MRAGLEPRPAGWYTGPTPGARLADLPCELRPYCPLVWFLQPPTGELVPVDCSHPHAKAPEIICKNSLLERCKAELPLGVHVCRTMKPCFAVISK